MSEVTLLNALDYTMQISALKATGAALSLIDVAHEINATLLMMHAPDRVVERFTDTINNATNAVIAGTFDMQTHDQLILECDAALTYINPNARII